ncbi:MAG TPA: Gmad2 immunoglobulin-like domain-containing protein [Anaerolineaceae bacterium]|nr:Gmad2 immunoglobulin-like domain-containing protein [Anaerolineaceae bacterium]
MKRNANRFSSIIIAGLVLVLTSGCITINLGETPSSTSVNLPTETVITIETTVPTPPVSALTEETLLNMQYLSPMLQVPVQLQNGEFSGVVDGVELNAKVRPGIALGDLNRDGIDDAALLLSENTGGSGVFVSLIAIYSQGDHFQQAPVVMIDDRPVINQFAVENGSVNLSGLIHGPNDPMVDPTTTFSAEYRLFGDRLVQAHFASAFGGGDAHVILITMPLDGEEVSGTLRLAGNMPIGPFENNLALTITDPAGKVLVHEGFMVQAADMGAPATFDNSITLPVVNAGTELLVALSELSMADGTPIAVDSVVIKVK